MTLAQLKALYKRAKAAYYNAQPIMTDAKFDKLEDRIKELAPDWAELNKTGVKVLGKKTEVELEHFMPSLNKHYPEAIGKWLEANPPLKAYIVMDKLDGSSLLVTYLKGKPVKVVTRGNGTLGKDISFLIPHLKLKSIKDQRRLNFRCEALLTRTAFKKWAKEFDNSRNMVNGILNRRTAHPAMSDIQIVVLGVYGSNHLAGLVFAKSQGLPVVPYVMAKPSMVNDLESVLMARRKSSEHDVDGLVIAPDSFKMIYRTADKPKGITAFKVNAEADEVKATVKEVIWQVSGRARVTPKIRIAPTVIDGVTVQNCAAHNPKWMMDHGIGPGAVVKLVRSGGVIPKIVGVVKPAKFIGPTVPHKLAGRFFVVSNASAATQRLIAVRRIHKFMTTLGIELLAAKTIARLYDSGLTKVSQYVANWSKPKVLGAVMVDAGLGVKQSANIIAEIQRVLSAPIKLSALMTATQIFGIGIGERKLKQIEAHGISMDGLLLLSDKEIGQQLMAVGGFSTKTIKVVLDGFPEWRKFYKFAARHLTLNGKLVKIKPKAAVKGKLSGHCVTFTGYRDKDEEAWVESQGGEVISFSSKTSILLYREDGKASTKLDKARARGVKVTTFNKLK